MGTEIKHAVAHFGLLAIFGSGLILLYVSGCLLLALSAVVGSMALIAGRNGWAWGTLSTALVMFMLAGSTLKFLRQKAHEPVFRRFTPATS